MTVTETGYESLQVYERNRLIRVQIPQEFPLQRLGKMTPGSIKASDYILYSICHADVETEAERGIVIRFGEESETDNF